MPRYFAFVANTVKVFQVLLPRQHRPPKEDDDKSFPIVPDVLESIKKKVPDIDEERLAKASRGKETLLKVPILLYPTFRLKIAHLLRSIVCLRSSSFPIR